MWRFIYLISALRYSHSFSLNLLYGGLYVNHIANVKLINCPHVAKFSGKLFVSLLGLRQHYLTMLTSVSFSVNFLHLPFRTPFSWLALTSLVTIFWCLFLFTLPVSAILMLKWLKALHHLLFPSFCCLNPLIISASLVTCSTLSMLMIPYLCLQPRPPF